MYHIEKKKRAIALKRVASLTSKEINAYLKSPSEILVTYSGRNRLQMSATLKEKLLLLVEKRKEWNVDIAGIFFKDNLEVTFIFYINGNPEDAYYEKNNFYNQYCFEVELDMQLQMDFIPPEGSMLHVFYPEGCDLPKNFPMDAPMFYL